MNSNNMELLAPDIELVEISSDYERSSRGLRRAQPSRITKINHLVGTVVSLLLLLVLSSCGNWGWETIETDNENQLNIFGLISLDNSVESFVVVHKTLGTDGPDEIVGVDENDYPIYESLYVVKDATVIISNGSEEYIFERKQSVPDSDEFYWYGDILNDAGLYQNQDQNFIPLPSTTYKLSITTPDGMALTGSVTTPPLPEIKESNLPDTLSIRNLFQVEWEYKGEYSATIATGDFSNSWDTYICGMDQYGIIEAGDTTWNSNFESWCYDRIDPDDSQINKPIDIRLRYLDENYYKYFLAADTDGDIIANILIGSGGTGVAYGVEGGFGVFGAFSSDWAQRIAIP